MYLRILLACLIVLYVFPINAGENTITDRESFAKEYVTLKVLLQKVKTKESAILYKPQIQQELDRLKSSQISGSDEFSRLSEYEQQVFIKKYQNNHFHCGEVTQVMKERRRILLDPDLFKIIGPLVQNIP